MVLFGYDVLPLTPAWERDNPIVLAPFRRAIDLCRQEGYERLAVREALRCFDDAVTARATSIWRTWQIRDFLSYARLPELALRDTKDSHLIPIVCRAIESGDIIGLRKGEASEATQEETAEQRRLVRKIEQIVRTSFSYSGRQYKLVVDADLAKTPSRNSYEVVDRDDANRVLDGVASQSGIVPELTALLAQASEKLTRDWRPPLQPNGLILLRKIRESSAAAKDAEPAISPSQMKQQIEQVENVHPVIEGTLAELDLSEVDLPAETDESEQSSESEESANPETPLEKGGADHSGESPDER